MPMQNTWYMVKEAVQAWVRIGTVESNTWIGRSRVLNSVYAAIMLRPGDEVHDLMGGTFLIAPGCPARPVSLNPPLEESVLLRHGKKRPAIPTEAIGTALECIDGSKASAPTTYREPGQHVDRKHIALLEQGIGNEAYVLRNNAMLSTYAPDLAKHLSSHAKASKSAV